MEHMEEQVGVLKLSDAYFRRRFHVIHHKKKVLSKEAKEIMRLLEEELKQE